MLKLTVKQSNVTDTSIELKAEKIKVVDVSNDFGESVVITFHTPEIKHLKNGYRVLGENIHHMFYENFREETIVNRDYYTVMNVNEKEGTFELKLDKYIEFPDYYMSMQTKQEESLNYSIEQYGYQDYGYQLVSKEVVGEEMFYKWQKYYNNPLTGEREGVDEDCEDYYMLTRDYIDAGHNIQSYNVKLYELSLNIEESTEFYQYKDVFTIKVGDEEEIKYYRWQYYNEDNLLDKNPASALYILTEYHGETGFDGISNWAEEIKKYSVYDDVECTWSYHDFNKDNVNHWRTIFKESVDVTFNADILSFTGTYPEDYSFPFALMDNEGNITKTEDELGNSDVLYDNIIWYYDQVFQDFPNGEYDDFFYVILNSNEMHRFDAFSKNIIIYMDYYNDENEFVRQPVVFEYEDPSTLKCSYDIFSTTYYDLFKNLFGLPYYVEDATATQTFRVKCYRGNDDFKMSDIPGRTTVSCEYSIYFEVPSTIVQIPFTSSFDTTLTQEMQLKENLIDYHVDRAINDISDLEKNVFHPSIFEQMDSEITYPYIHTLNFNLHFREHRGLNWQTDRDSFWNGVQSNGNGVEVNEDVTADDCGDLLQFLGFTDADVFYQKNKLKKSFLRLSYYDSPYTVSQNLLGYSTIFMDTGSLYTKYINNREDTTLKKIVSPEMGVYEVKDNPLGLHVNTQRRDKIDKTSVINKDLRLGCSFSVSDKHISTASSEGFYIYLWRDMDVFTSPMDIYMKVEFNHAGYGRTIPMMMPYWDRNKHPNRGGRKTLKEIVNDFTGGPYKENKCDGKYGMTQYRKFSYIHLQCGYDELNHRYVYYLSRDTYGSIKNDNGAINLNLYEAKIM